MNDHSFKCKQHFLKGVRSIYPLFIFIGPDPIYPVGFTLAINCMDHSLLAHQQQTHKES